MHALHYACRYGHLELFKYIFGNPNFDIDLNVVDQRGNTPLHQACITYIGPGQFEVVKFLLQNSDEKGIDVYKKNNDQETAEDFARRRGHKDIVELLELWTQLKQLKTIEANIARLEAEKFRLKTLKRKHFD